MRKLELMPDRPGLGDPPAGVGGDPNEMDAIERHPDNMNSAMRVKAIAEKWVEQRMSWVVFRKTCVGVKMR